MKILGDISKYVQHLKTNDFIGEILKHTKFNEGRYHVHRLQDTLF